MRSVSSEDLNKEVWVTSRLFFFFPNEEGAVVGKTISSEREINKSNQSLWNKATEPGLMEVGT